MAPQELSDSRLSPREEARYVIEESAMQVRDIPASLRPREEMARLGPENVSDVVLLAIILRTGTQGVNVVNLAQAILNHYDGSLTQLAGASIEELKKFKGISDVKAQMLMAALQIGRNMTREAVPEGARIKTPTDAVKALIHEARHLDTEVFWTLHLDSRNCLRRPPEVITQGLLDASLVHPREVFRDAIRSATAAVLLAHNHPSGDPTPSAEDIRITRQLVEAGKVIDIKVLDHVIIGRHASPTDGFVSMREQGVVDFG